jgi:hypothetical protein
MSSRVRVVIGVIAAALLLSSCYELRAINAEKTGAPVPWWCAPTESNIRVTDGPASGSVDWYVGVIKAPLSYAECKTLSKQFDVALAYAQQWPTEGEAEADGFTEATPYVPGMGTHHILGGMTPQMLNDPSFDRNNPILDDVGLDDVFDPAHPEVLQYDGNGPDAKLVGFDYYVRTNTGLPPAGFPGTNDWWHHHPKICMRKTDAAMIGFNTTDSNCTSMNGINVNMANYYMLHVWVVPDMTFEPDVYAGMMPCISGGTAVHDVTDPCHTSRTSMAMAGMDLG